VDNACGGVTDVGLYAGDASGLSISDASSEGYVSTSASFSILSYMVGTVGFEPTDLRHPKPARCQTAPRPGGRLTVAAVAPAMWPIAPRPRLIQRRRC